MAINACNSSYNKMTATKCCKTQLQVLFLYKNLCYWVGNSLRGTDFHN